MAECLGCAHKTRRFKFSRPRDWCARFHYIAEKRCHNYRTKRTMVQTALAYLKQTSTKPR